jgi:chromate transporter
MADDAQPSTSSRDIVSFGEATRAWFGISLRTFGGPAGQIAVMHEELVDKRRWVGEQRFLHALSYCTLLPGPEAQQLAIYLGWLLHGTGGGLVAGTLFVLPGYVTMMALSAIYVAWGATTLVAAIFVGLGPAVLAIVAQAVVRIGTRTLRNPLLVAIAIAAFASLQLFAVPFPVVIVVAGIVGYVGSQMRPTWFTVKPTQAAEGPEPLIADDALHGVRPSLRRATVLIVVGGAIWALPVIVAALTLGRSHVFVDQGLFFSGTAVVTFGGAYAVLSFVAQRAVETYGWLQAGEMVHGLALAESTPGPLIMVVQFVGFLGAYRNPGDLNPWVAAIVGSSLVVWVTFVPCFLFVFLGAPHIEGLRGNRRISAALTGVTAAVVGVIANLSVYFAVHTLFERTSRSVWGPFRVEYPQWSSIEPKSLAVAVLAFVFVFRLKLGTLRVLAICALLGAVLHMV